MGKKRTRNLEVGGTSILLEDLRWLVAETERAPDNTPVRVRVSRSDRPGESTTEHLSITIDE